MNTSSNPHKAIHLGILLIVAHFISPSRAGGITIPSQATEAYTRLISFEVISIRKSKSEFPSGQTFTDDGFSVRGFPLSFLISTAYDFRDFDRLRGLPGWCLTENYDIQAKIGDSDISEWKKLSVNMKAVALQTLLADRFRIRVHREYSEGKVYELVVAKSGLKAKKAKQESPASGGKAGLQMTMARYLTMDQLASALPNFGVSRPVVDRTGLTGMYDCSLRTINDDPSFLRPSDPSIVNDLHGQLGLDLRPAKGQVEVFVIDHIERPADN